MAIRYAPEINAVVAQCPFCRKTNTIDMTIYGNIDEVKAKLRQWQNGAYIQDVFPQMPDYEREALMTGICDPCWNETFSDEEDEEGDE